jgi:microcompartment protein CcmL/EutN
MAMLDVADVPAALAALDALAKEAEVSVLARGTIQSGRYLILFGGGVEAVQLSEAKAREAAGEDLHDRVLLPWADERIVPAVLDGQPRWPQPGDTLGVVQNGSPPTLLRAVDAALKGALIELVQLRVGDGLGGKGVAMLWGETSDVEAALELAAEAAARGRADGFKTRIVRNADPEVAHALAGGTTFFQEWRG